MSRDVARKTRIAEAETRTAGTNITTSTLPATKTTGRRKVGRPRRTQPAVYLRKKAIERLTATSYCAHHHISDSRRHYVELPAWLRLHEGDPAFEV